MLDKFDRFAWKLLLIAICLILIGGSIYMVTDSIVGLVIFGAGLVLLLGWEILYWGIF